MRSIDDALSDQVEAYLRRIYVVKADARQQAMGLSYVTCETRDLAREVANFIRMREADAPEARVAHNLDHCA